MNRKSTGAALLAAMALFIVGSTAQVRAEDHHHGRGHYDGNHHFQPYVIHNHHHGYWDQRGGVQVFINVD